MSPRPKIGKSRMFTRLAAAAGASVLALGIVSCSSTGGAPQQSGEGGGGGGTVDTPG